MSQPYGAPSAIGAATVLLWTAARWPRSRTRLAPPLALAAALSLATTAFTTPPTAPDASWARLGEAAVLLVLLVITVRWAPSRHAAAAALPTGAAVAAWPLPLLPDPSLLSLAGAAAFWSLPVLGAAVVGGYPRLMEHRRHRLVVENRRSQQLELARDLHDFVAHDVSGIVAQAQAARFVAASDPGQALPALERIEAAGLSALKSMDRMVKTLHAADGGEAGAEAGSGRIDALPGIDALPALVERFSSTTPARSARLRVAPGAADGLSHAAGSTAYRVVVEALTNVRRHAAGASRIDIVLTPARTRGGDPALRVDVADNGGAPAGRTPLRRAGDGHGGRGLAGLRERVHAAGGTLSHGHRPRGGWRLVALLPTAPAPADAPARTERFS
ncbi:sensor histidine kinase [Streptomyces sp. WAC08241]|uniref:sensor histidine kinase n=1 Tax=Streptomyces sp. WAC08241 TaxID=2487421 RepID=UPI000F77498C|nr:histidine kinase [Streptomyces sp. WAC08241]RSS42599.1 two-component sensor histidine kinase [Streptomyces sp. WAC08241]